MGDYNNPLSLNRWMYVEGNPINFRDPSGKNPAGGGSYPRHCQSMPAKAQYAACVLAFFNLEPIDPNNLEIGVDGERGCYTGPIEYRAPGFIEGLVFTPTAYSAGIEVVYDFATMQSQVFTYNGWGLSFAAGFSDAQYLGIVKGFKTSFPEQNHDIIFDYRGFSVSNTIGIVKYPIYIPLKSRQTQAF